MEPPRCELCKIPGTDTRLIGEEHFYENEYWCKACDEAIHNGQLLEYRRYVAEMNAKYGDK